jgi:hypothetical protein
MIFGMTTATYTLVDVLISLAGIGSGFVVMYGLLAGKRLDGWNALFLVTTAGFGFPFIHLSPGNKIGILSMIVLAIAVVARYALHLAGAWRRTYVVCAALALYFNVFVLVVQLFEKVPVLRALAPTQREAPFLIAQLAVLALFVVLTIVAVKRSHADPASVVPAVGRAAQPLYEADRRPRFFGVTRGGSYASVSVVFRILYLSPWGDSKSTISCTPSRAGMPGASCERLGPRLSPACRYFFFFADRPVLAPRCSYPDSCSSVASKL